MKDRVLRIIREALTAKDLLGAIRQAFQTEIAREIMTVEFFSSDDYEGRAPVLGHHSSGLSLPEENELRPVAV